MDSIYISQASQSTYVDGWFCPSQLLLRIIGCKIKFLNILQLCVFNATESK